MNYPFDEDTHAVFDTYCEFLLSENKKINLTAIKNPDDVFIKHFADSVYPLDFFHIKSGASVIDIGSGGGFPGVPLKILRPDISLTCLDSTWKKIVFLRDLSDKINVPFETAYIRAEDAGQSDIYREKYDVAISRAVAALPVLSELCLPLVKKDGYFIALKGGSEDVGLAKKAFSELGGVLEKSVHYKLPNGDERRLFVIKKIKDTPEDYPRIFSSIKKYPL